MKPRAVVAAVGVAATAFGWWQSAAVGLVVAVGVVTAVMMRVHDRRSAGADDPRC